PFQRPGVDHIVVGEPGQPGRGDAVGDVPQVIERGRVAVDGELDPGRLARRQILGRQVHPGGRGVDLQGGAGPRARRVQRVEVDVDRRAAPELAGERVADDVHEGV